MLLLRSYRNLGATAATFEGHGSGLVTGIGGLYYQFGRSVPFANKLGSTIANVESSQQTFAWAVKNPLTFIFGSTWSTQDTSTSYLWNDKNVEVDSDAKSFFDPSPIGWRIPLKEIWSDFYNGNASYVSDNVSTYTLGTTGTANHYAVGYRHESTSIFTVVGSEVRLYSSTPARDYRISTNATSLGWANRGRGHAIRAIRE